MESRQGRARINSRCFSAERKAIEEPELVKRLGQEYLEYRSDELNSGITRR